MITTPDEVWSTRIIGKIVRYYLKYYQGGPVAIVVADKAGMLLADAMYELTADRAKAMRRGELIYINR